MLQPQLYGLGSISKQFTATAIMLLVEEGKLGLDDRVTNYFAWLPKEWGGVTVRHLLTHTSGSREEQWKDGIVEFDRFEHDQEEVVRTAFGPMVAPPGERFAYSNVGYRLLGMLIEKASGQSYWNFLEQRISRGSSRRTKSANAQFGGRVLCTNCQLKLRQKHRTVKG